MSRLTTLNEYEVEDLHILFKFADKLDKAFLNKRLMSSIVFDLLPSLRDEILYRRLVTNEFGEFTHSDPKVNRVWYWLVAVAAFVGLMGAVGAFVGQQTDLDYKVNNQ